MHLWSRQATFQGPFGEIMEWATGITAHVSDLLGSEVGLWSAGFGAPTGTLGWSMPVDGLAGVAANNETVIADADYHTMLARGQELIVGTAEDQLYQIIHGELGEQRPPVGSVATITRANIGAPWADVIGWGVEMAQLVEGITGTPVLFGTSMFGTFGEVGWIGVNASAADADAGNEKLIASEEYVAKVGEAPGLFVDGSGHRTFMTRVG